MEMDWQTMIVMLTVAAAAWVWMRQVFGSKASGCGACPQSCGSSADEPSLTQLDLGPNRVDK